MAKVTVWLRHPDAENDLEMSGEASSLICATLVGGIVPPGGVKKMELGDLKIGDKVRCPHDSGPELEVVPAP